jgi:hypothetical protein
VLDSHYGYPEKSFFVRGEQHGDYVALNAMNDAERAVCAIDAIVRRSRIYLLKDDVVGALGFSRGVKRDYFRGCAAR